jgi:hypothetical protein
MFVPLVDSLKEVAISPMPRDVFNQSRLVETAFLVSNHYRQREGSFVNSQLILAGKFVASLVWA